MAPLRILLIDDEPDHRELIALALRANRPEVEVTAVGARDAFVRALGRHTFDCIVMDYNLPDCAGPELLRLARRADPRCPVIVVSCSSDQRVVIQSLRCGGVDFVPKLEALQAECIQERVALAVDAQRRRERERRRRIRRHRRLKDIAERDPLTGLYNRRRIRELLHGDRRAMFDRRGRTAIVMADIDHFKRINDTFGHAAGDSVLRAVAEAIRRRLGPTDEAYRWGGEEFLVFLADTSSVQALEWAEGVRRAVEVVRLPACGETVCATLSLGVVNLESAAVSETSIEQADQALYEAKRRGRNRVCVYGATSIDAVLAPMTVQRGEQMGAGQHR